MAEGWTWIFAFRGSVRDTANCPHLAMTFPAAVICSSSQASKASTCCVLWYPSGPGELEPNRATTREFSPFDAEKPLFAPQSVRFEPSVYVPPQEPGSGDDEELWWRRYEMKDELEGPDSRLGGYAYYDPDRYGLAGGFENWETVMQVDSFYPSSDMLWGDNGKLAFFVRRGCLKRRAFGRVCSVTLGAG